MTIKEIIEVLVNYNFVRTTFPQNRVVGHENSNAVGYCDHENHDIFIDQDVSVQRLREIIIHELVHANLHLKGKDDSEKIVKSKSRKLYDRIYKPKEEE